MFTCPEDDIHSIYLDNELPPKFVAEYEAHLASCPKCKAKLEKFRKIHEELKEDSDSITLSKEFLDQSFERLQSRMRYAKAVNDSKPKAKTLLFPELKKYIPAAVAAAAVFAVMLPFSLAGRNSTAPATQVAEVQMQTLKRNVNFTLDQGTTIHAQPASLKSDVYSSFTMDRFNATMTDEDSFIPSLQKNETHTVNDSAILLTDDFFMPDFAQSEKPVLLKVYVPAYVEIPALNK